MLVIHELVQDVARCVGFLSRIRMPSRYFVGYDGSLTRAVRAFPLAGIVIALPSAALLCFFSILNVDPLFAASAAVAVGILITGALHEDGLSDAADGLLGGQSREAILAIMKDSRIGTYGGVTLGLSLLLRVSALSAILPHLGPWGIALTVLSVASLSRAAMVWHWSRLPSARTQGVASGAGAPEPRALQLALISGFALALTLLVLAGVSWKAIALVLLAVCMATMAFTRFVDRKIGGHTGDTIGATQQITEIAVLAALALAV